MRTLKSLLLGLLTTAAWGQGTQPCQPSREIKQALQKLTYTYKDREPGVRALRERFPNDVFVHRDYQETAQYLPEKGPEAVVREYRALLEKHPDDSTYVYLAASSFIGYRTKEAIPLLERIADFPPASLALVQIFSAPNFKNKDKAQQHLQTYLKACPAAFEAYSYLRQLDASDFTRQSARQLRELLRGKTDPEAVRFYGLLWGLEFKATPLIGHAELRKLVTADIQALRAADPGIGPEYLSALREGYELVGDTENAKWAREELLKRPSPNLRAMYALQDWDRKNPRPKPDARREEWAAYYEAALKTTAAMLQQYPSDRYILERRFSLLRSSEKTSAAEVEAVGEAIRQRSDIYLGGLTGPNAALQVAELYAAKGVRLDRLGQMVAQGLADLEKPMFGGFHTDLYPGVDAGHFVYTESFRRFHGWASASTVWMKLNQKEQAREALQKMDTLLPQLAPSGQSDSKDAAEGRRKAQYPGLQGLYWQRMAEFALLETRKLDALMFYQNGLLAAGNAAQAQQARNELAERTRGLWKDMGGTNEGWQAWYTRSSVQGASGVPSSPMTWLRLEKRFPEFDLADQRGQKWNLAALRGKTVLLNVWATW